MANQPKKYKKFVATAATATLVASAIVPVASAASFSDVTNDNSHAEAINALVEAGIINGYPDGTFKPNATLARGHVVKMLGKWVEAQGFEVPADWNTVQRFTDLAVDAADQELVKYAAVVKDAGVFNGSNGALMAAGSMTRENMALTLDRAYKAIFGQSLVEEAADLEDVTVADLATAKEEAREAIQALRNLGITNVDNFNPKASVTRGQFASFLNRTINVEGGQTPTTPEPAEVEIASLKANKNNELTVEFNKAVDTNAAVFEVKRGTVENVKVSKVVWNEAGTIATLTMDHKFVDATYNLTVTGVAEEALTASVTTTKEVATEIKFNNDKLVLTGKKADGGNALEARITFEVYNQYGEIITDKTPDSYYDDLKLKGIDTVDPKNGEAEVRFDTVNKGTIIAWIDKKEDEGETGTISFTYEFGDVEIDVDQDVVLSDDLEPGSVKIEGIHSVSGYEFNAKNVEKYGKNPSLTTLQDEFFLLLSVKDQYGNPISAKGANRAFAASSDTSILTIVQDGLRVDVSEDEIFDADEENIEIINVDGKDYFAIRLEFEFGKSGYVEKSGENTVSIRSKATGEVAESKITLEDSSKVYSIGLSAPEEVVAADEKVKLPVTVVDQNGNAITDAAKLNKDTKSVNDEDAKIDFDGDFVDTPVFINENGKLFLEFTSISNPDREGKKSEDMDISVEVVDTKEESELTLKVQPSAYAANLVKISDNVSTTHNAGTEFDIKLSHFVIEDQYGRVMDEAKKEFTITAQKIGTGVANLKADSSTTITENGGKFELVAGNEKGSTVFEFTLASTDNNISNPKVVTSKLTVTLRTVDFEETFDSYKIKGESLGYFGTDGADSVDFTVVGITSAGKEVQLTEGEDYQLLPSKYFKNGPATSETTADSAIIVDRDKQKVKLGVNVGRANQKLVEDDLLNTFKTGFQVAINRTGETLIHEVTLSNVAREFTGLTLEDPESIKGSDITQIDITASAAASDRKIDVIELFTALNTQADITVADQYGLEIDTQAGVSALFANQDFRFTISNVNSTNDDYKIANNGSYGTSIEKVEVGDTFDVTIVVDKAVKTVKFRVVPDSRR